jgi:hypothetical protein
MKQQPYGLCKSSSDIIGYRQGQDSDTWHFCRNCFEWPRFKYVEEWVLPDQGKVCGECVARSDQGRCRANIVRAEDENPYQRPFDG